MLYKCIRRCEVRKRLKFVQSVHFIKTLGSQMHLWSTNKTPQFNQACSYELTFAQKPVIRDEQKPIIDIDDLSVSFISYLILYVMCNVIKSILHIDLK